MTLLVLDAATYTEAITQILRVLCNDQKQPGIYVTVNRPYDILHSELLRKGIDDSRLIVVDAVTRIVDRAAVAAGNCVFLDSPQNLTDISIALTEAARRLPEGSFLFLDSLSTLLVYNDSQNVSQFAHFLTLKMRQLRLGGVLLALRKHTDEKVITELAQYCDNVIDLSGKELAIDVSLPA